MTETFSRWDAADDLKTDEDIALYFEICTEEDPGDGSLIRSALGAISRARGMTQLARATGMSRDGLYTALSSEGNPSFATILKVTRALGLKLQGKANRA
jgi:probable addiction module antidote protein